MDKIIHQQENNVNSITDFLPENLKVVTEMLDGIVQTHIDSLSVATITGLASLCNGTTVSLSSAGKGRPVILYGAAFMQSGTGKSAAANIVRKYILNWKEEELKSEDVRRRQQATKEVSVKPVADVFLEAGSAEGLEASLSLGSSPFVFMDEFGLLVKMAKNDTVKQALIRGVMSVFDSGSLVTRRLKDEKRTSLITAKGMGLFAVSTLGVSNLSNDDIKDMISNGALNRFIVTFGGVKGIPLKDELTKNEAKNIENFGKRFAEIAKNKSYYFSEESFNFYRDYHSKIKA